MKELLKNVKSRWPLRIDSFELTRCDFRIQISHKSRTVEKLRIDGKWYYFKHNRDDTQRELLELEACYGEIYRLFLGNRAPRMAVVEDDHQQPIGLLVEAVPGFRRYSRLEHVSRDEFIAGQVADVLAAAYFMQEDDLHNDNFGINADKQFCKIDHDMSLWPISIFYKGDRLNQVVPFERLLEQAPTFFSNPTKEASKGSSQSSGRFKSPLSQFLIRQETQKFVYDKQDIQYFPNLTKADPKYWPAKAYYLFQHTECFSDLSDDKHFHKQAYAMFLFILLTEKDFFRYAIERHIKDLHLQKIVFMHLLSCKNAFREELLKLYDFKEFLKDKSFDKLWDERLSVYKDAHKEQLSAYADNHPGAPPLFDKDRMRASFESLVEMAMPERAPNP